MSVGNIGTRVEIREHKVKCQNCLCTLGEFTEQGITYDKYFLGEYAEVDG